MEDPINETLWHDLTQEVMTGMREWRLQHPKATFREIEPELDAGWAACARVCSKIWRWRVPPPTGRTPAHNSRPAPTVASRCSRAVPTHARSRPTAART